jgi:excinuclease ABC subunit B
LREGLDLPEVSLVAIFDSDKEGFLRSPRSLIQTIGRAARNASGRVIMYADKITPAMKYAIEETNRRRVLQEAYNTEHGIVPQTVVRAVMNLNPASGTMDYFNVPKAQKYGTNAGAARDDEDLSEQIQAMRLEMFAAAENLEFEKAARLRDELKKLEALAGVDGAKAMAGEVASFEPYAAKKKRGGGSAKGRTGPASAPKSAPRAAVGRGRGAKKRSG